MKTLLVRQSLCYTNSDYLFSVAGLNRLVELVGLLTPPGFDAAPSTSKAIERRVAVHNDFELVGFNPSATSSPGESSRGKRTRHIRVYNRPGVPNMGIRVWSQLQNDDTTTVVY